jgi:MFS transporter, Spinster family, sphingosine-1-phosphate transporter
MTQPASPTANPLNRVSLYAWIVVLMLWPVATLNYLDRMMVATMRSSIRADIPTIANDADFGLLMALFLWVYALLSPVGGYLADRFNRRWAVILSLFIWSAVTWMTGHAKTFEQMAWARGLMGLSEACYMPAALALIAELHGPATRSRAIGVHLSGVYMGQALGGLGGYIADTSTWRNAFYWFGAAGVAYAFILLLFLRDSKQSVAEGSRQKQASPVTVGATLKGLLGVGSFLILVLYFTLPAMPGWAVKSWLPTHLATAFNLKQGPAGMSATGYVTMASFAGVLIGGAIADWWMRKGGIRGRIYTSALGTALCVPALLLLGFAPSLPVALIGMVMFGLGFGIFDCNNMPILCQLVRPEYRATGYGIMNMVSISTGAGVTWAMGAMRDRGISLSIAFTLSAIVAAIGALSILFARPREERTLVQPQAELCQSSKN